MSSSQFSVESFYLPDLSDIYNECELFWQTAADELQSSVICDTADDDTWKIPDDWFIFNNEPNYSDTSRETEELLSTYHPNLPPISMAFSMPSNSSIYGNVPSSDCLIPELDPSESNLIIDFDLGNGSQEFPLEDTQEYPAEDTQEYPTEDSQEYPIEENISNSESVIQHEIPEKSQEKELSEVSNVTETMKSEIIISDINSSKYPFSDMLIHGASKQKRRKTVRELLLDKQQHMIIHRICENSQLLENTKKNINGVCTVIPIEPKDLKLFENGSKKSKSKPTLKISEIKSNISLNEVPRFRHGKVDAKEHRPRHYEIEEFKIGNFVVKNKRGERRILNRLKVLFSKRRFVYEFEINYNNEGNRLACIIVPFNTITAIKCSGSVVMLKVDVQPLVYLGSKQQGSGVIGAVNVYDRTQQVDVSDGEIKKNSLHKLLLRKYQADKMKLYLWHFDVRFKVLTQLNFSEEDQECVELPPPEVEKITPLKQKKKGLIQPYFLLNKSNDVDEALLLTSSSVCACRTSCKSIKCSCVKATRKCNSGRSVCVCSNCDNPLNILEEVGIDPVIAVSDICLIQNIYKLSNLRMFLIQTIKTGCCKFECPIKNCIPGVLKCPNSKCNINIQYSWCQGFITDDDKPRNHCSFCGQCNFWERRHCLECNKCHNLTNFSKCPNCPPPYS